MSEPAHVLVVAHQTAATPALLDAVRERARSGPATFHLVVPRHAHGMHKVVDPQDTDDEEAQEVLGAALPKLGEAAGRLVTGSLGDAEPLSAIQDAVNLGRLRRDHHLDAAATPVALAEARPGVEDARARATGDARGGGEPGGGAGAAGQPGCSRHRDAGAGTSGYRLPRREARHLPGARRPEPLAGLVRTIDVAAFATAPTASSRCWPAGVVTEPTLASLAAVRRRRCWRRFPSPGRSTRSASTTPSHIAETGGSRPRRRSCSSRSGVRWRRPAARSAAPRSSAGSTTRAS